MRAVALGELCDIRVGRTPPRANKAFWGHGEPWLSIADMSQGTLITATKEQITPAGAASGRQVPPGTVLLSFKLSIGKVAIAGMPLYTNEAIAALPIRNDARLDPQYLLRALQSLNLAHSANRAAMGATLNRAALEAIRIPLPTLSIQRRITAILDHADALRIKRRQTISLIEDLLTRSTFLEQFDHPASNRRGWPVVSLAEIGTLERGVSRHRPRNDPVLLGGPHPLIQTGDIANSGGYITSFTSTYSDLGLAQSRMWPQGTLCITIAANIARTGILSFDACFPDSVVGFSAEPDWVEYVRVWLSFLQATLEANAPQSAQKNINLETLRALPIPVPPATSVAHFAHAIRRINAQCSVAQRSLLALEELFTSLQARAFSSSAGLSHSMDCRT